MITYLLIALTVSTMLLMLGLPMLEHRESVGTVLIFFATVGFTVVVPGIMLIALIRGLFL